MATKHDENYGKGEASIDDEVEAEEDVNAAIGRVFSRPNFKAPMLPAMALEVMRMSRRPQLKIEELVAVVAQDPLLAADVLKLARSAAYATLMPARSLKEAALRMGIAGVQSVVLEALQRVVFKSPAMAPALEAVRKHGAAVAHLARAVARHTSVDAEFAFLCGLLHDIGLSAGLVALGMEATPLLDSAKWQTLESLHEQVAALLAKLWQLSPEIAAVLGAHHVQAADLAKNHPAVSVLAIAEHLANDHGVGLPKLLEQAKGPKLTESLEAPSPGRLGTARQVLRLSDQTFAQLHKDAEALIAKLSQTPA